MNKRIAYAVTNVIKHSRHSVAQDAKLKSKVLVLLVVLNLIPLQARANFSVDNKWGLPVQVQETSNYELVSLQSSNLKVQYSIGIQKSGAASFVSYTKSSDFGQTWTSPYRISKENTFSESIQGATNQSGQDIVVSWRQYFGTWSQVIRVSHDFGQTWSEVTTLDNVDSRLSLFISNNGKTIVVLPTSKTSTIWKSVDGGLSWVSTPNLGGKASNDYSYTMRNYSRSRETIVKSRINPSAGFEFSVSQDAGYSWTNPKLVSIPYSRPYGSNNATAAAISNDGKHIAIAWKSGMEGNDYLVFVVTHDGGVNWSNPTRISSPNRPLTANLRYQLTISEDGKIIQGAWGERNLVSPTIWDIVTTGSVDGGRTWGTPEQLSKDNNGTTLYVTSMANSATDDIPAGIAMTSDGTAVVVAWYEYVSNNRLNYIAIKSANQSGWKIERVKLSSNDYCPQCELQNLRISEDGKNISVTTLIGDSTVTVNYFGNLIQNLLLIANSQTEAYVGQSVLLTVTGGSGSGRVEYKVTGVGCSIIQDRLTANTPTVCNVIANKQASGVYSAISSEVKTFRFVPDPKVLAAEAEAKAAELKAKQEAEAKAAAELKAKQEAEAKAASELMSAKVALAKSEADLKTAVSANAILSSELEKVKKELTSLSSQLASISAALKATQASNVALTKKLTTICKAKPKPKGC